MCLVKNAVLFIYFLILSLALKGFLRGTYLNLFQAILILSKVISFLFGID